MYSLIKLKPGKEHSLKRHHPWVFSGAINQQAKDILPGDTVEIQSYNGQYLGHGHYADGSIAVRIFSFTGYDASSSFWLHKLESAYALREKCGLVNNAETNIYRLVHAEGDGMPGLVVDIYGDTAVLQSHSAGMHHVKSFLCEALQKIYGSRLKNIFDKSAAKLKQNTGKEIENTYLSGSLTGNIAWEHGHRFLIDWEEGQKTGFFIDQRENRKLLAQYSKDKKVLNTFCYTGGFSVYALKADAMLVHSLDSSQRALDITTENIKLNKLDEQRHACIKADAVEYLKNLQEDYDIIVLDPPAFAKNISARHKAMQGYTRINEAAIRQIKKGGIIFTFSCSQAVNKEQFAGCVTAAAIHAGRDVRILHQLHQPADHPVSMFHPEGEYLKGLVIEVT
ncbi:MAG: class I SAM-dependent rRNA methyltransferase [Flavobacteriales bacterium]